MAKQGAKNGSTSRLEEAMAMLIQNQAAFNQNLALVNQNHASLLARISEMDRVTSERFARLEGDLATVIRVLAEHTRILERLPDAVRD